MDEDSMDFSPFDEWDNSNEIFGSMSEDGESDIEVPVNPSGDVDMPSNSDRFENPDAALTVMAHRLVTLRKGRGMGRGYGGFGALGHYVYHRELLPRMVKGSWNGKMSHLATGGTHTAAVSELGEVYTWGRDEGEGRLGLGPGGGPDESGALGTPTKVDALPVFIEAVTCGGFFTLALISEGLLWSWGRENNILLRKIHIILVVAFETSGKLTLVEAKLFFTSLSDWVLRFFSTREIRFLLSHAVPLPLIQTNSNFELGRGDKISDWRPQPIPTLQDVRIIQIASGGYHSLTLTDDGKVLSWGHGGRGQLGNCPLQGQKVPVVVEPLTKEHIVYIACGGSSSAAITEMTDKGKLYMWGNARDCQLGIPGLPEVHPSPVEVMFLVEEEGLGSHHVLLVAIGASHAMCLVSRS